MEKKRSRKKIIIILVVIVTVVLLLVVATYFFVSSKSQGFSFVNQDFSSGAGAMDKVSEAGDSNAFENTKLNPFEDSS